MLFNSLEFAIFFPIVTLLFFILPHKFRWLLLLLASCFFYMFFKPIYILILIITIIIDYYAGIWIEKTEDKRNRKRLLLLSIFANVGILVVFKYYNFLVDNFNIVMDTLHTTGKIPMLNIILPIGLSFHTFQAMSYTIEVYRGNQKAEKHFGIYALYVMFYPQLVAGPIERPQNILHQFHEKKYFEIDKFISGLKLIFWGLFKKVVIADRLAIAVDSIYNNPFQNWSGLVVIIATVFFSIQIYCDFSGYSDIAIGTARCMGFNLMVNFNQPYFSKSISEFWSRWHISLSTWFKDYVYIPLGGNRVRQIRLYLNLLIVFIISGIWHGANITFIVWGALHGFFLIASLILNSLYKIKINKYVKILFTFSLVCLSWIFFRANDITQAKHLFLSIFHFNQNYFLLNKADLHGLPDTYLGLPLWKFLCTLLIIPLFLFLEIMKNKKDYFYSLPLYIRWIIYYFIIFSIIFFGVYETGQFIYFQF